MPSQCIVLVLPHLHHLTSHQRVTTLLRVMVTHNASAQLNFVAQGYVNMDLTVSVAQ